MKKNIYPGKFIVFEGLDGSGQTTQANLLKNFLEKKGFNVFLTKEPTKDSEFGKIIDKVLHHKEKISSLELQKLFIKDREWHLKNVIEPTLKEGKIVISDRYFFSTFAFGGIDVDMEKLIKLNDKFLMPDLTIFLDVRPEICIKRILKRKKEIAFFEKEEKLKRVYKNYLALLKKFPIARIDGEKDINLVSNKVKEIVREVLRN